jgi:hypothetical protein
VPDHQRGFRCPGKNPKKSDKNDLDSDALERIQRRATRMICGLTNMEYPQRLQVLNIPTLLFTIYKTTLEISLK